MSGLAAAVESVRNHTDLNGWYWLSYGEKCYAFATVEAITMNEDDPLPRPGSQLTPCSDLDGVWVGENRTEMLIASWIATVEEQNGDAICSFIAEAHAAFVLSSEVVEALEHYENGETVIEIDEHGTLSQPFDPTEIARSALSIINGGAEAVTA